MRSALNGTCSPREGTSISGSRRGGEGLDLASSLEAKFGARCSQVHQIRRKIWGVLLLQDAKIGKESQFWGQLGVISEIQRAKFGVSVTYIFGRKIWGSDMNFRGKIWGQAPRPPCMEVLPLGLLKSLYLIKAVFNSSSQLDLPQVSLILSQA